MNRTLDGGSKTEIIIHAARRPPGITRYGLGLLQTEWQLQPPMPPQIHKAYAYDAGLASKFFDMYLPLRDSSLGSLWVHEAVLKPQAPEYLVNALRSLFLTRCGVKEGDYGTIAEARITYGKSLREYQVVLLGSREVNDVSVQSSLVLSVHADL